MRAYELSRRLFSDLEDLSALTAIESILVAYSDSHDLEDHRNLNCFVKHGFYEDLALEVVQKCIKSYNAFDAQAFLHVLKYFGHGTKYYFAREGSVCIYVKPGSNFWIERFIPREAQVDEFSYEAQLNLFRLWWD